MSAESSAAVRFSRTSWARAALRYLDATLPGYEPDVGYDPIDRTWLAWCRKPGYGHLCAQGARPSDAAKALMAAVKAEESARGMDSMAGLL